MDLNPLHNFLSKPKCPSCGTSINWGVNTYFDDDQTEEVCAICHAVVKKD